MTKLEEQISLARWLIVGTALAAMFLPVALGLAFDLWDWLVDRLEEKWRGFRG